MTDTWLPSDLTVAPMIHPEAFSAARRIVGDKLELSQALGERVLLPAVRAAGPDEIVLADGFSCCEQITQSIQNRQPRHLAEVLQIALRRAADAKSIS